MEKKEKNHKQRVQQAQQGPQLSNDDADGSAEGARVRGTCCARPMPGSSIRDLIVAEGRHLAHRADGAIRSAWSTPREKKKRKRMRPR